MKVSISITLKWVALIIGFSLPFLFSYCKSPSELTNVNGPMSLSVKSLSSQVKYGMHINMEGDSLRIPKSSGDDELVYARSVTD